MHGEIIDMIAVYREMQQSSLPKNTEDRVETTPQLFIVMQINQRFNKTASLHTWLGPCAHQCSSHLTLYLGFTL